MNTKSEVNTHQKPCGEEIAWFGSIQLALQDMVMIAALL
jgi:hypothetical protein